MTRLVVHIGLPKTGSTAVQGLLSANADVLAAAGLHWANGLRGPNQTELAIACTSRPSALAAAYGVRSDGDRPALRRRIRRRLLRAARAGDLLVSSEHLAGLLRTRDEIDALAGLVDGIADDVLVVAVLRRGDHWLPSAYAEAVRSGRPVPYGPRFVQRRAHLLDHRRLARRWSRTFGADAVRLVPFLEIDKTDPTAVPARVLAAAGLSVDLSGWQHADRISRSGLGATAVEVLRRLAPELGTARLSARQREEVVRLLGELVPGPGVALSPAAARALAERDWVHTGAGELPQAYGADWPAWNDEPPAPVRRRPVPTAEQLAQAEAALRRAGLTAVGDAPGTGPAVARGVRRLLSRIRG